MNIPQNVLSLKNIVTWWNLSYFQGAEDIRPNHDFKMTNKQKNKFQTSIFEQQ